MDIILAGLSRVGDLVTAQSGTIVVVMGVLFTVSKMVSNEKAPLIVSKIQLGFDKVAKVMSLAGSVVQKIADNISLAIKSDGLFGKK